MGKLFDSPRFYVFVFTILFVITYWRVPFIFFVQDELLGFGLIIDQGLSVVLRGLGDEKILHFVPINNFLNFLTFSFFNLQYPPYNFTGLLFHFINGLLVYRLAKKIFDHAHLAIISSIIFTLSAIPSQLIMWPVVSLNTISLSFALLAWNYLLQVRNSTAHFKLGLKVAFFVLLSILTLEYSLGLLIFIPIATFIYCGSQKIRRLLIFLLPLVFVSMLYFGLRVYPFIYSQNLPSTTSNSFLTSFSEKLTKLSLQYAGQVFVPQQLIENFAALLFTRFDISVEYLLSQISVITGIVILIISAGIFLIRKINSKINHWRENLLVALIFIGCSSLPFLFIPGLVGNFDLYPPRYLYFGLLGASIIITLYVSFLLSTKKKTVFLVGLLVLFVYLAYNIIENWKISGNLYEDGQIRLGILNSIVSKYKTLPSRVIFYTESDTSFYGLPPNERVMPFQSGFGQTLLIWYRNTEKFSKQFFENKFLWEITDQGYKEFDGRGFGYFRNFNLLAEAVEKNNVLPNDVIAFNYNSNLKRAVDITSEVRGRLEGYLVSKKEIDLKFSSFVGASDNVGDAELAIDKRRDTFWDSKIPYGFRQFFEVEFKQNFPVAQVRIDTYNNKDQNEVGFKVLLSTDGREWDEVFYSRRYPPLEDGIIDIYFKPTDTRYIRIEQIGAHEYASWVIHELSIYEVID